MTGYAFSIDLDRCIGCQACVVGCKAGNERPFGGNYIQIHDIVSGQLPVMFGSYAHHRCFHCADAACVIVCPTHALSKAETGLTSVDQSRCSGCGYCTSACPYRVPILVERRVSKCVACPDPIAEGGAPYCVQTCPSQAIQYGERDQILAGLRARLAAVQARYPNAQIYGETQLGGLGLLTLLLDKPEVYDLPADPMVPAAIGVWQNAVQPLTLGAVGLSAAVAGFAFVIARRQHLSHAAELHAAPEIPEAGAGDTGATAAAEPREEG